MISGKDSIGKLIVLNDKIVKYFDEIPFTFLGGNSISKSSILLDNSRIDKLNIVATLRHQSPYGLLQDIVDDYFRLPNNNNEWNRARELRTSILEEDKANDK